MSATQTLPFRIDRKATGRFELAVAGALGPELEEDSPEELNFCTRLWPVSRTQALPLESIATSPGEKTN